VRLYTYARSAILSQWSLRGVRTLETLYLSTASVVIGILSGSLPFSVWLVRWIAHADVRKFGDGNPGAINAWRAGGWRAGVPVLVLDVVKGGLPVALARFVFELGSWSLVPVALSPVLGHVVSPWLRFRGGKGIAATFGVWSALTFWIVPTTLGLSMAAIMAFQTTSAWTVMMAALATLMALLLLRVEAFLIVAFVLNLGLLAWTHRKELLSAPKLRAFRLKKQEGED
jgi:glycerol-3-phosphate acyltransferase PlsY